jgi:hypothetical protein
MSEPIDPVEYGKLLAKVEALEAKIVGMDNDIKTLLALANQSKGGFWMGMAIASFAGGIITWFANHLFK